MTRRQAALLAQIINEYRDNAEPISSKLLSRAGFYGLSSATIRAEMNQLEQSGYLVHLHTSGGRVPTDKGYRYFVNNIVESEDRPLDPRLKRQIQASLTEAGDDLRELNRVLAQTLAHMTGNLVITAIENVPDFYKTGLASLFEYPEFQEVRHLARLASFSDQFERLFVRVEREMTRDDSINVFIGRESPLDNIEEETIMVGRYDLPYGHRGSVTIVGPMRMDYAKHLGLLRHSQLVLNALAQKYE